MIQSLLRSEEQRQCDQMVEHQDAQIFPKVASKK